MSFHIDPVIQSIYKLNDDQVGLISSSVAYDIEIDEEWMLSLKDVLENDDHDIYHAFLNDESDENTPNYFSISSLYEVVFYVNFGLTTLDDFRYLTQDVSSYEEADDMIFLYDHHQFYNLDENFHPKKDFLTPRQFYDYYIVNGINFHDAIEEMNQEDMYNVTRYTYQDMDITPEELVKDIINQVIDRNDINQRVLHNGDETLIVTNGNEGIISNLPLPSQVENSKTIQDEAEIRFLEKMMNYDLTESIQNKIDGILIRDHYNYFTQDNEPRFSTKINENMRIKSLLQDVSQRKNPRCKIGFMMYDPSLHEYVEYASDVFVKDDIALWTNPEVAILLSYNEVWKDITHGRIHMIFHPERSQVEIEENGNTTTTLDIGIWNYHEGIFEGVDEKNLNMLSHGLVPVDTSMYKEVFQFIDTHDFSS